jgi:flap endonuclease-1
LVGLFHKTINLFECGIKPVWVFDGEPPKQKMETLKLRKENKAVATEEQKEAMD